MVELRKSWMSGIAVLLCTVLWFALLAQRPLFDPDEGRYAEIPREMMLSGGDWVIPHLNGIVYLEKPPLQYWLTALAFRAFGQNEFAARLCTGLAGYLSLAAVFFLGRKLWGFDAGVRAALFSAASTLFVLMGHQLTLDMLLSFWLTAALSCFLMAQARREDAGHWRPWMLGCWAAMALGLLTKGLIAVLIPAATLGAYVLWQRDWRLLRRLNLRWGVPLFAAIAAPWFVLAARANGQFLEFFFVREHFLRFLTPIEHRTEPWWFFVPVLTVGIIPWLPQAARALVAAPMDRVRRGEFDTLRLLWIWCVFVLVFLLPLRLQIDSVHSAGGTRAGVAVRGTRCGPRRERQSRQFAGGGTPHPGVVRGVGGLCVRPVGFNGRSGIAAADTSGAVLDMRVAGSRRTDLCVVRAEGPATGGAGGLVRILVLGIGDDSRRGNSRAGAVQRQGPRAGVAQPGRRGPDIRRTGVSAIAGILSAAHRGPGRLPG